MKIPRNCCILNARYYISQIDAHTSNSITKLAWCAWSLIHAFLYRGQKKGKLIVSYLENTLHLLRDCVEKKCGEKRRAGAIEETEILSARENERLCVRGCVWAFVRVYMWMEEWEWRRGKIKSKREVMSHEIETSSVVIMKWQQWESDAVINWV